MVYGYARVSTKGQLEGNSIEEQTKTILKSYENAEIITESYSAAKERPIFNQLIEKLGRDDILVITKLDRFCRTTKEGLEYIDNLLNRGVKIHILNMGLIEDTPMGRLIVTNLLAFAEFERALIIERTQAGKAIAKLNPDFREGRPRKYKREHYDTAMELLETHSVRKVSRMVGIPVATLCREIRRRKEKEKSND